MSSTLTGPTAAALALALGAALTLAAAPVHGSACAVVGGTTIAAQRPTAATDATETVGIRFRADTSHLRGWDVWLGHVSSSQKATSPAGTDVTIVKAVIHVISASSIDAVP